MKIAAWTLAVIVLALLLLVGVERLAAERVEVVELHTVDEAGARQTTRLWIVDDDGYAYLRVGAGGSGWYARLGANDTIEVTRDGRTVTYTTTTRPDKSEAINALMAAKYTWGDTFIGTLVGGRDGSIPIELHPVD